MLCGTASASSNAFVRIWDAAMESSTCNKGPISKPVTNKRAVPTTLQNLQVDSVKRSLERETELPLSYKVKPEDVICGHRGCKETHRHVGNERYRVVIEIRLQRYSRSTRPGKSEIVKEIVDVVREYGGRFVRFEDGKLFDIGNLKAREKTGHAIRGAMHKHGIPVQEEDNPAAGRAENGEPRTSKRRASCDSPPKKRNLEASSNDIVESEQGGTDLLNSTFSPVFDDFLTAEAAVASITTPSRRTWWAEDEGFGFPGNCDPFLEYARMKRRKST